MFMGNYRERNREREIFRLDRFPNIKAKKLLFALLSTLNQRFFAVTTGHHRETCEEKASFFVDQRK